MRKAIIALIILIAGGASAEVKALRNLDVGDSCPSFCAPQLDGAQLCSSDHENSILVTSFVRMDQKESLKVLLALQDLHDRYSTKNVHIIGILSGEIDRQELLDFIGLKELTLPLILDRNREIYGSFGVFVYPTLAVFGQDGKLRFLFGSNTINIGKRVEGTIRFLLAEIDADELEEILHPVVEKT
ncbi:MAG: TlpA family protein disulfide reductase, partial [Desulfofustis sp.]|nr:TlpA family protein disulfide reductase [Desulfofustis sp.]